jgi:hypothetical protein
MLSVEVYQEVGNVAEYTYLDIHCRKNIKFRVDSFVNPLKAQWFLY